MCTNTFRAYRLCILIPHVSNCVFFFIFFLIIIKKIVDKSDIDYCNNKFPININYVKKKRNMINCEAYLFWSRRIMHLNLIIFQTMWRTINKFDCANNFKCKINCFIARTKLKLRNKWNELCTRPEKFKSCLKPLDQRPWVGGDCCQECLFSGEMLIKMCWREFQEAMSQPKLVCCV